MPSLVHKPKIGQYEIFSGSNFTLPGLQLFHDESPYHVETSPFICFANQWTGFYTIGTTVMKELISFITSRKFLKGPKYITTS